MQDCMEMHRLKMQLQDDFARNCENRRRHIYCTQSNAGDYNARQRTNARPFKCRGKFNARLFIARINNARKKTLQEPIKARIRAQKPHKTAFLRQNQTKNAKCIKIMSI